MTASNPLLLVLLALPLLAGCGRMSENAASERGRGAPTTGFHYMARRYTLPLPPGAANSSTRFVDVAQAAGLAYRWTIAAPRPCNVLDTIGNGCAFLDYDGDGNLDILLIGPHPALYKGDGKGHFTDVTHATGLDTLAGHFLGCAVGDYDNDGYPDIYLSAYRGGVLLHNEGGVQVFKDSGVQGFRYSGIQDHTDLSANQTSSPEHPNTRTPEHPNPRVFRDVTKEAGIAAQPWGTSCAFMDYDNDGRLDLYIGNYVQFGPESKQHCDQAGIATACGPTDYAPEHGVLYRNLGAGRFTDVTQAVGAANVAGKTLGVTVADIDGSGRSSLILANDEMPGDLLQPAGGQARPTYANQGRSSGIATDRDGNLHGGMGIDCGDVDNDGRLDVFVATFQHEAKSLYHNDGGNAKSHVNNDKGSDTDNPKSNNRSALFNDISAQCGISSATVPYVAFGCKFFDYDNDGWLDLIIANGHVQDNISAIDRQLAYRQPTQLFHNDGRKSAGFEEVTNRAGADLSRPLVGRGVAVGDFDNDGRMDALVVDSEGAPLLLHNASKPVGHWLLARLEGTRSNRDGYGAMLTATVGGRQMLRACQSCGSYLSASDKRVHFGLGAARQVDRLVVRWPSGQQDVYTRLPADRQIVLREGAGGLEAAKTSSGR